MELNSGTGNIGQTEETSDRIGVFFAHLIMAVVGAAVAVGYFLFAAVAIWGLLGLGITALLQLCFSELREMPLFAAAGITVAPVFMALSLLRSIFKRPRKGQVGMLVNFISKLYPPRDSATHQERHRYQAALPTAVKTALSGVYLSSLVIVIGFAAAVSVGYGELYSPADIFNVNADDESARSIIQNFLFWLNIPFDFLLLEAPSTYGIKLSELQTNGSAYGFLTLVLLFRLLLVSAVIDLVIMVMTAKVDPAAEISYEQAMGVRE